MKTTMYTYFNTQLKFYSQPLGLILRLSPSLARRAWEQGYLIPRLPPSFPVSISCSFPYPKHATEHWVGLDTSLLNFCTKQFENMH